MPWRLEGTYFENCNCDMVCPCATSGLTVPGDQERCTVFLAFHIDSGEIDGLDVSGLSVAAAFDTPSLMSQGGWRAGLIIDAAASDEQADALGAIFSGQRGGILEALAPLIGEVVGIERATIDFVDEGRRHRVKIGDAVDIEVEDFVSGMDPTGKGIHVSGVGFPADTLAAGTAVTSKMTAFGMSFANEGKNSFSAPFSWAA